MLHGLSRLSYRRRQASSIVCHIIHVFGTSLVVQRLLAVEPLILFELVLLVLWRRHRLTKLHLWVIKLRLHQLLLLSHQLRKLVLIETLCWDNVEGALILAELLKPRRAWGTRIAYIDWAVCKCMHLRLLGLLRKLLILLHLLLSHSHLRLVLSSPKHRNLSIIRYLSWHDPHIDRTLRPLWTQLIMLAQSCWLLQHVLLTLLLCHLLDMLKLRRF